MADTSGTNTSPEWKKRETFGSAIIQIVIVGVVLLGSVGLFYKSRITKKNVGEQMAQAKVSALRANPNDLKKALKILDEAFTYDSNAGDALAMAAALNAELWLMHHEPGAEQKAKELLERAKKADSKGEDRYGTEALLMVAAGNPKGASDFIEELRKKGASTAKLYWVNALALKAQGNLTLSHTGFTTAMDKAWKDPRYPTAWGEAILEEGVPGAADAFNKGLAANPDFFRARLGLALARVMRKDRIGESETMVKDVLARDAELSPPLKARAIAIQAHIANIQNTPDAAIALADDALKQNPDDVWALFAKANALALKKDAGAAQAYDALIARQKAAPVFYFEGAARLQAAGMLDQAMALLDKYEQFFKTVKNPTADGKEEIFLDRDDRYWITRGDVLKEAGKLDEAIAAYDKGIAAKNVSLVKATFAKASVLLKKSDFDGSLKLLADITPPDGTGQIADAYVAMGEILFHKKDWGPGCQSYAYALARMKVQQAPREQLNQMLTDVEKRLKKEGQAQIAKVWMEEAKPMIQ